MNNADFPKLSISPLMLVINYQKKINAAAYFSIERIGFVSFFILEKKMGTCNEFVNSKQKKENV